MEGCNNNFAVGGKSNTSEGEDRNSLSIVSAVKKIEDRRQKQILEINKGYKSSKNFDHTI